MTLGITYCDKCKFYYSEHTDLSICPHPRKQVVDENHDQGIKRLFHKLWGEAVGKPGYNKADWMELQNLLQTRGIEV